MRLLGLLLKGSALVLAGVLGLIAVQPAAAWLNVRLTQSFFDSLGNRPAWDSMAVILIGIALVNAVGLLVRHGQDYLNDLLSIRAVRQLESYLFSILNPVTITRIETPDYNHDLHLLRNSLSRLQHTVISLAGVCNQAVLAGIYGYIILLQAWPLLLIVLLYQTPSLIYEIRHAARLEKQFASVSQQELEMHHLSELMTKPYGLKELLLFGLKPFLLRKWQTAATGKARRDSQYKRQEAAQRSWISLLSPAGLLGTQLYLLTQIIDGSLTIGGYMAMMLAIGNLEQALPAIGVQGRVFKQIRLFSHQYAAFAAKYGKEAGSAGADLVEPIVSLEAENIHYSYPGSDSVAVTGVSLHLHKGDFIAIVGENGSGKSTLGKILLGLHDLNGGELYVNGTPLRGLRRESVYARAAVVHQDYLRYPMTIAENIAFDSGGNARESLRRLSIRHPWLITEQIARQLDSLAGMELLHSKPLSGGQWQRIAIARALHKPHDVLLLDEATSELDPEAEVDFLTDLLRDKDRRITILITHNLKLAALADRIFVMRNGEVAEEGPHRELMNREQRYAAMYRKQNERIGGDRLADQLLGTV